MRDDAKHTQRVDIEALLRGDKDPVMEEAEAIARAELAKARGQQEAWAGAVAFLRGQLGLRRVAQIRALRDAEGPLWYTPYHFGTGMEIRNRLRGAGFGEERFGITNLDNIYVRLLEDAAGVRDRS